MKQLPAVQRDGIWSLPPLTRVRSRGELRGTGSDAVQEGQLLRRIRRGDRGALASLYDAMAPRAYGLALRILQDPRLAQEAVQEAFLRIWGSGQGFDPRRGTAVGWVLRIARNAAIDQARSRAAHNRAEFHAAGDPALRVDGPLTPEASMARSERATQLRDILEQLPEEQRRVIEIAYFQGLSHSEIAKREGVPLGTVKTRIRDGVRRLRKLSGQGEIDEG